MKGMPAVLNSSEDWLNAYSYALRQSVARDDFVARLQRLRETKTILVLKKGVTTPPEKQTPADFEPIDDPASPFARSGLALSQIDDMIAALL